MDWRGGPQRAYSGQVGAYCVATHTACYKCEQAAYCELLHIMVVVFHGVGSKWPLTECFCRRCRRVCLCYRHPSCVSEVNHCSTLETVAKVFYRF